MHRIALTQLALWTTFAQAFFPYIPIYACDEYHGCGSQEKRTLEAQEFQAPPVTGTEPDRALTFKLWKRTSPGTREPPAIAARQAERLRRKFGFVGVATTLGSSKGSAKRDNAFPVVTAATPTAMNSVGIDQDGSDISYFVEATIGSSGEAVYLLCDTGAGTTWVMGEDCESTACQDHTTWSSSGSTTFSATGETFSIAYGTGSVEGSLVEDSMTIGSVKVNMKFGLANVTSDDFTHFAFDGILGLSMASGSSDNFLSTLKSDGVLSSNVFSVDLNRNSDGANTGQLTLGGTDPKRYSGDITYTPVDSAAGGDWAIPLGDLAYAGTKAGLADRLAYVDTGTTYAFGPAEDVAALHKLIPGANSTDGTTYMAPCDSDKPIVITFSGVDHEISVKDWLSAPSSSGVCTSNIYGQEVVAGGWLLGDVFLKNVYAVFDADASQIGFATKATTTTTSASSTATVSGSRNATATSASSGPTRTALTGSGDRLESRQYSSILCIVAVVAMMAF